MIRLYETELSIKDKEWEYGYLFDPEGEEVLGWDTKKSSTSVNWDWARSLGAGIMTHNHPAHVHPVFEGKDAPLSGSDYSVAAYFDAPQVRAVSPSGRVHVAVPPDEGWHDDLRHRGWFGCPAWSTFCSSLDRNFFVDDPKHYDFYIQCMTDWEKHLLKEYGVKTYWEDLNEEQYQWKF